MGATTAHFCGHYGTELVLGGRVSKTSNELESSSSPADAGAHTEEENILFGVSESVCATIASWRRACSESSGNPNRYYAGNVQYVWSLTKQLHDGSVTGLVQQDTGVRTSFKIDPSGRVIRGNAWLRRWSAPAVEERSK